MDIALLNLRITFQKNETVTDENANHVSTWEDYYSCFATISGEGGSEKDVAGTTADHKTACFTVRYCKAVSAIDCKGYRIVCGGEIYNIRSVDHMNNKRKTVKFTCEKVVR